MSTLARLIKQDRGNYTNISNQLIRDSRLSWKARGIFAYLWSQADEWDFYVSEVAKHATDGRDALRSGLKELENYGYLTRKPSSGTGGQFDGMSWVLTDKPAESAENAADGETRQNAQKSVENPSDGKAVERGTRWTEDPTLRNNNSKNYQEQEVTTERNKDNSQSDQRPASPSPVNEKEKIPYKEIIDYLNEKTGSRYKNVAGNQKMIRARWNEGYRLGDFKKVIDTKTADWLGTYSKDGRDMSQYLRLSTLFGTKFDQYLNEKHNGGGGEPSESLFDQQWTPKNDDDLPF